MSITADDVVASIEMILGWTPDQALVEYHLNLGFKDRADLGRYMISTDAFRSKYLGEPLSNDSWEARVAAGRARRDKMMSFGPYAYALVVKAKRGLFLVDPEDSSVTATLLRSGEFGEGELALASSLIDSESNVLLVGTHIGGIAVPLSKRCANLDAVEANPATQELVEANFTINNCTNVTLHKLAANDQEGTLNFYLNRENSGGSKRKPVVDQDCYIYDSPEEVTVRAAALDDICAGRHYDLIFMDIEGSEFFALKGMQQILSHAGALCMEFLPHHIRDVASITVHDLVDQIEPHFEWLYIPEQRRLVAKAEIRPTLATMYDQGLASEGLYFLRSLTERFVNFTGLARPEN